MNSHIARLAALALMAFVSAAARAIGADYAFEPLSVDVRRGNESELAVRIVHRPTGKRVEGATIISTRLDMAPDGMAEMIANLTALPDNEPGVHRFRANLSMGGRWALRLQAKVPGEPDAVEGTVVFRVK